MSFEEETINPIINFFHKLLGNNLWILPVAVAIASWYIFYLHQDKWIMLYIAIICSIITILHIFSRIFIWIRNAIKKHLNNIKVREALEYRAKQKQAEDERKDREHAASIWKLVGHLDKYIIMGATLFLTLEIRDEDKHIRFVKIPKNQFSEENKRFSLYFDIVGKLTFKDSYGHFFKLIKEERVNDIMYFYIDPYFYNLIENFQLTQKWIKI